MQVDTTITVAMLVTAGGILWGLSALLTGTSKDVKKLVEDFEEDHTQAKATGDRVGDLQTNAQTDRRNISILGTVMKNHERRIKSIQRTLDEGRISSHDARIALLEESLAVVKSLLERDK